MRLTLQGRSSRLNDVEFALCSTILSVLVHESGDNASAAVQQTDVCIARQSPQSKRDDQVRVRHQNGRFVSELLQLLRC
jgi:hypothetical protein